MSSSESIGLSDEHDPMAIVSDDEIAPALEIFTSDSETDPELMFDDDNPADFQPFALPDFGDDNPFVDDVLAFPLPIHDQLIIGHPDGEHIVEPIPIHVVPLAAIPAQDWPFVVDLNDDIYVPVIEVDHIDDDLGDGEVCDIAILDVESPVVSVIDISSDSDPDSVADSFESVIFSALLATRLRAYPTDDDDAMSVAPSSPVHVPTHAHTPDHPLAHVSAPIDSLPVAPLGTQTPHTAPINPIPGCSLPPPTTDTHQIDLPTIFPHEIPAPRPGEGTTRKHP
ncbi:hypothetical protein Hdeb2414_s0021g00575721 [Helianthus debilis subsp. tardiflorus]